MQVGLGDAGQVQSGPTALADPLDRGPVDLDLADPHAALTGNESKVLAAGEWPAAKGAGHHHAATLDREHPIDREGRRAGRVAYATLQLLERCAHSVHALAGHAGGGEHGRAGQ